MCVDLNGCACDERIGRGNGPDSFDVDPAPTSVAIDAVDDKPYDTRTGIDYNGEKVRAARNVRSE